MARALDGRRTPRTLRPPSARAYRANVGCCVAFLALVLVVPPPSDLQAQVRTETRRVVREDYRIARLERAAVERLRRDDWEVTADTRAVIRDVARLGLGIAEITGEDAVDPSALEARFGALIDSASRTLRRSERRPDTRVIPSDAFADTVYSIIGLPCWFWPFCEPRRFQ